MRRSTQRCGPISRTMTSPSRSSCPHGSAGVVRHSVLFFALVQSPASCASPSVSRTYRTCNWARSARAATSSRCSTPQTAAPACQPAPRQATVAVPVAGYHGGGTAVEYGNHVRSLPPSLQESPSGQELYPTRTRSHAEHGDATTPIDQICWPQDSRGDSQNQCKYNARVRNRVRRALWNRRTPG